MITGAIIGGLVGGSFGAYYGAKRSGQFFSYGAFKWMLIGAIGEAAAGAFLGGTIYLLGSGVSTAPFSATP
jgi:hypothetical protein